jgi:hypothetical protein
MPKILDAAILVAATATLAFVAVWLRDEIVDWRSKRHHREADREWRGRRR